MEAFFYPPEPVEKARYELTRYYYNAISAHGTYILSVVVGIFTWVQAFHYVTIENGVWRQAIASVPIGILSTLLVYFAGRIFVYTKMLGGMGFIRPMNYDRIIEGFEKSPEFREYGTVTPMLALERALNKFLYEHHKRLMEWFAGRFQYWMLFISSIVFSVLTFVFQRLNWVNF